MIIDFRVRPPAKGFENMLILGEKKGFQFYPFNYSTTEPIPSALEHSMPLFMKEMEEAGIDIGVILPRYDSGGWGGVSNDAVADVANAYPGKLINFGGVNVSKGIREAVVEVERAVKHLGARGIVLEPGMHSPALYPTDAKLYPVYDRCAELGVHVVISQSMLLGPDISYANPVYTQRIANDFPTVNFIIAHAGYPYVLEAAGIACACPNVYFIPDLYMHIGNVVGNEMYAKALRMSQGKRWLFGSAYPVRGMKQSVEEVKQFNLPAKEYEMLMYSNAAELLGL